MREFTTPYSKTEKWRRFAPPLFGFAKLAVGVTVPKKRIAALRATILFLVAMLNIL
jgi:hypothetical protein